VDSKRPSDADVQRAEGIRPDAVVPPGVWVDPWDDPLDPGVIEPGEPLVPRAPERFETHHRP
jgi:hypothetical protein